MLSPLAGGGGGGSFGSMSQPGASAGAGLSQDRVVPLSMASDTELSFQNDTSKLYHSLLVHWRNELSSPDILQYQDAAAEGVRGVLQQLEGKSLDNRLVGCTLFYGADTLLRCEKERLRFMLLEYLRIRLAKIERAAEWLGLPENAEVIDRLAPAEQNFLRRYAALASTLGTAMLRGGTDGAPAPPPLPAEAAEAEQEKWRRAVRAPALNRHVFCQFREHMGEISLFAEGEDPGGQMELVQKGDLYLIRYQAVRRFVESGDAVLL